MAGRRRVRSDGSTRSDYGKSWTIRDGSREVGVVTISHSGGHGNNLFAAWSAVENRHRWSLAAHSSLDAAVARVTAFDADPEPLLPVSHRVSAEAVERLRK